jgi:hypothetical protein
VSVCWTVPEDEAIFLPTKIRLVAIAWEKRGHEPPQRQVKPSRVDQTFACGYQYVQEKNHTFALRSN